MKQLLYTYLAFIIFGLAACQSQDKKPDFPEITVGDGNITVIKVDKNSTIDLKVLGGNGKYKVTLQDSKIAKAEIEGEYLKVTGLKYGKTSLVITSHDQRRELTVMVERPEFNLTQTEVRLYPGDTDYVVKVTGGGDDGEIKVDDPQGALEYVWNENNSILLTAKHEGVAVITFISKDDKPDKTLTVKIIAEDNDNLSEKIGLYATTSHSLYSLIPTTLAGYRKGAMVWICGSTHLGRTYKRVEFKPLSAPKEGEKVSVDLTFVNVDNFAPATYDLIVEKVHSSKGLVVLRGAGFKIVAPFDK
ncbi:hypothetical protein QYZ87_02240 [Porphyromonadaceae bacterium W3.11]|nr:hypothetical protein [Porphyromonadaceae bacterium W3.11]